MENGNNVTSIQFKPFALIFYSVSNYTGKSKTFLMFRLFCLNFFFFNYSFVLELHWYLLNWTISRAPKDCTIQP